MPHLSRGASRASLVWWLFISSLLHGQSWQHGSSVHLFHGWFHMSTGEEQSPTKLTGCSSHTAEIIWSDWSAAACWLFSPIPRPVTAESSDEWWERTSEDCKWVEIWEETSAEICIEITWVFLLCCWRKEVQFPVSRCCPHYLASGCHRLPLLPTQVGVKRWWRVKWFGRFQQQLGKNLLECAMSPWWTDLLPPATRRGT